MKSGKTALKNKKDKGMTVIKKDLVIKHNQKIDTRFWVDKFGVSNERSLEIYKDVREILETGVDMNIVILEAIKKYDNAELVVACFGIGSELGRKYKLNEEMGGLIEALATIIAAPRIAKPSKE